MVRRSVDAGQTWKPPTRITRDLGDIWYSDITAEGSQAFVAYTDYDFNTDLTRVLYRQTRTAGARWSEPRDLAPDGWSSSPVLQLQGGVLRALFGAGCPAADGPECVYYRRSLDGRTWTEPEQVSHDGLIQAGASALTFAQRLVVMYSGNDGDGWRPYVRVRVP